ncbi:ABC transporter permease [Adhaeribacter radiodurans]|uniref:ABC transporter permease n=1 Tax=Adhaeribacter radiodurans TaxID=2745197 RepID=A0A7L7LEC4_9BACT|nr:ABC transporter permease [Adhaeribacter radiodurans]QMU31206.1 ABC transporter permease [Adhaeribacter radiodurans]
MLRNHLIIAWRNLWRHKIYGFTNLAGLASGLAVSILILLFVAHELTYDRFHTQAERIYRVVAKINYGGNMLQMMGMSAPFGPAVQRAVPEVQGVVRLREARRIVVKADPQHRFFEDKFIFADSSLFTVFSFVLKQGNARTVLSRPGTVVISDRMAHKYFGDANPIGKTLTYDNKHTFEITGLAQNPPSNSTLDFDFVGSFSSLAQVEKGENSFISDDDGIPYLQNHLGSGSYVTYFLLNASTSQAKVEKSILKLLQKTNSYNKEEQYTIVPLLGAHLQNTFGRSSEVLPIYISLGIALSIMLLAILNYMSLTTAQATKRAKEVGVRKVMGASRSELAVQFYGESILTCLLAFGLALMLVQALQPAFYNLLGLRIDANFLYSPVASLTLLSLLVVCALLAGSYPALLLSRFSPVAVLKGKLGINQGGAWVRRAFTVFQFAVSVGLIIGSLVVQQQLNFVRNRKLGFYKEQVLVVPLDATTGRHAGAVKNEIRRQTGVQQVAAASSTLFEGYTLFFTKSPTTNQDVMLNFLQVDESFLNTLDLAWKIQPEDKTRIGTGNTIIINEAAVKKLQIEEQPIGQVLKLGTSNEIVGVLKDFNYSPLHKEVEPLYLSVVKDTATMAGGCLFIRLDPKSDIPQKVAAIGATFQKYQPEKPFEYTFLNDSFNALYKAEDRLAKMFAAFTGFAIFIAALGLFGLVTYMAETRTKEIGIRKVLGASASSIVALLSRDFCRLVILANLIAWPLAWWVMHRWLENYPYRITLSWWTFIAAGLGALLIALLTISFQAIKTALDNPVKALRNE